VGELLDDAEDRLEASDLVEHPHAGKERYDAEELLAFVLGQEMGSLDLHGEVDRAAVRRFRRMLDRRLTGEPNAYIIGQTEFGGLTLVLGRGAFIPRESSEFMAHQALRRLRGRPRPVHVDLATGIGPVALVVARGLRRAKVFGVDISKTPVAWARRNAARLGLSNTTFLRGDLFEPLPRSLTGHVDVITVHPPYVGTTHLDELPAEIREFERRNR
jgi:release factor glutamine methyltransferase